MTDAMRAVNESIALVRPPWQPTSQDEDDDGMTDTMGAVK